MSDNFVRKAASTPTRVVRPSTTISRAPSPNPAATVNQKTVIGYGINALTAKSISTEFVIFQNPILKMGNLVTTKYAERSQRTYTETSSTLEELTKKVSSNNSLKGSYAGFTASISADYSFNSTSSKETGFTRYTSLIVRSREYFQNTNYKANLNPTFASDLNSLYPAALFEKYGTHVIVEGYWGGRVDASLTTLKETRTSDETMKVEVSAAFGEIVSGKSTNQLSETTKKVINGSKFRVDSVGGGVIACNSLDSFFNVYSNWMNSLNESTYEFCGVPTSNSLLPIWELTDNSSRKAALKQYFDEKASNSLLDIAKNDLYVTEIAIVAGGTAASAKANCPADFILDDQDLNQGSGGNYIYLCYKLGPKANAITNLLCNYSSSSSKRGNYELKDGSGKTAIYYRIDVDLNRGSGGKYIYLNTTRNSRYSPIRRVDAGLERPTNEWSAVPWDNSTSAADVNKGSGGKYIYIFVKR